MTPPAEFRAHHDQPQGLGEILVGQGPNRGEHQRRRPIDPSRNSGLGGGDKFGTQTNACCL